MSEKTPWRNEELMRELYWGEGMTMTEIAERLGCGNTTISKWLRRLGIETRSMARIDAAKEANSQNHATYYYVDYGYAAWQSQNPEGGSDYFYVHRLLAISEYGIDSVKEKEVHHINEIPWDNRPENIEVLGKGEHKSHHVRKQPRDGQGQLQRP